MSEEEREQLLETVKDIIRGAKAKGIHPGDNCEKLVGDLTKSTTNNIRQLRRVIAAVAHGFCKEKTYARLNRRVPSLKGTRKIAHEVNCILDTSGSMDAEINFVLREVYRDGIVVNLIQCDAQVQSVERIIDKKQFPKLKLRGFGGTSLQPAIDFISESKELRKNPTVILTDGHTDILDFSRLSTDVLILTTDVECPVNVSNGKVKQIKICLS